MPKKSSVVLGLSAFMLSTAAMAVQINGTIGFTGSVGTNPGGDDIETADVLRFGSQGNGIVNISNDSQITEGDFAPLRLPPADAPEGQQNRMATFTDLDTVNETFGYSATDDAGNEYTFDLDTITNDQTVLNQTGPTDGRVIAGTGIIDVMGDSENFDPTPGIFRFSTQRGGPDRVTFSASNLTQGQSVPAPVTLGLLGLGLVGVGAARKVRQRA